MTDIVERLRDGDFCLDEAANEIGRLRSEIEKWHRVAMEAGAVTCQGGGHIYPLRDRVKRLENALTASDDVIREFANTYTTESIEGRRISRELAKIISANSTALAFPSQERNTP